MKTLPFLLGSFLILISVHAPRSTAFAQATWSGNFHLPAVNGSVNAIAETTDAWFYGGDFTQVGSVKANHIVRVDKSTGEVTALGNETQNGVAAFLGPIAWVNSLAVIGTDLYVGGSFFKVSSSTQNAITARNIAKWDTLTSTWVPLGSAAQNGASGAVEAVVAAGADLYVGGFLTTVSSSTQNGI